MDCSTMVTASIAASAVTSILTTIVVLGASAYCNYLRSYFRHKYLNSIASDSDSSRGSDSSRKDLSNREDLSNHEDSDSEESQKSSVSSLSKSSELERFIWAHFTFDKIYAREDDDIV
jgi:hypothetical protein